MVKLTCPSCGKINPKYVIERCVKCGEYFPNYQKIARDAWKFKSILFVYSYIGASGLLTIWGQRAPSFEGRYLTGSDIGIVIGGVLVGSLITFGVNRLYRTVFDEDKKKQETQGVQATGDF